MKKVYQYNNYFETTETGQAPSPGWKASFNVSDEEAELIRNGGIILVENGKLIVIDENDGVQQEVAEIDEMPEEEIPEELEPTE